MAAQDTPRPLRRHPPLARRALRLIPVRVRQYWRLLAACATFLMVLTVAFGTERIRPYVTSESDVAGTDVTVDIKGGTDLFDSTTAHSLSLTFRDADYQRALDAFFENGEKEYVEADLTIDGTTVPSVGIRLKGNSTLIGLTRNGKSRQIGPDGGNRQFGGAAPGGAVPDGAVPGGAAPDGAAPDGGVRVRAGGGRVSLEAEKPENLPWLISFDEFVEGRRYQGHQELAVRVAGMGGGSTALNEALALELLAAAGEVTQRYAYTSFRVNDRPTTVRLLVEHPDEHFAEQLDGPGVLYKALSTAQFTDQGDDPVDYQDDFTQVTMKGSQDLQPVINLIRWVTTASDAEFDAHLADHVDVASFARYAALQNLLLNFDDMAGPGRNYYLWYNLDSRKFTVIAWDHNLTFSGNAEQGPNDTGGGMRAFPGGAMPDGAVPEGGAMPEGAFPGGAVPDGQEQQDGTQRRTFRGGMTGHPLKEKFLASKAFKPVYEAAYRQLYQQLYGSGRAAATLEKLVKVLATVDGYNEQSATTDANQLRTLVKQRTESLANNDVIKQG